MVFDCLSCYRCQYLVFIIIEIPSVGKSPVPVWAIVAKSRIVAEVVSSLPWAVESSLIVSLSEVIGILETATTLSARKTIIFKVVPISSFSWTAVVISLAEPVTSSFIVVTSEISLSVGEIPFTFLPFPFAFCVSLLLFELFVTAGAIFA